MRMLVFFVFFFFLNFSVLLSLVGIFPDGTLARFRTLVGDIRAPVFFARWAYMRLSECVYASICLRTFSALPGLTSPRDKTNWPSTSYPSDDVFSLLYKLE